MPVRSIVKLPASVLHRPADAVPESEITGIKIQRLIADMRATLAAAADGVGLAAPQINVPLRMFIVSSEAAHIDANIRIDANDAKKPRQWEYYVFINPVLKKRSRQKRIMAEGCLSIPGKFGEVSRADKVYLEWYDERAKKHARGFTKFFARVVQHEADHLEGVLIANRTKHLFPIDAKAA